ncbi:MAG: hypothetical protein ACI4IQ_03250 [Eubacterium sp.]
MNIIDIVFICIIAVMALAGAKKGLLLSLLSTVRFLVAIPLSFGISDYYYQTVYDNYIRQTAYNYVLDKINNEANVENYLNQLTEKIEQLPMLFRSSLDISSLSSVSNESIASSITDTVIEPVALLLTKIVLFAAVLIVFYILTDIIIRLVKKLRSKKHAPLHKTGSFLGALFGILKSFGLIYALSTIAGFVIDAGVQGEFIELLEGSAVLEFINGFNPLIQ